MMFNQVIHFCYTLVRYGPMAKQEMLLKTERFLCKITINEHIIVNHLLSKLGLYYWVTFTLCTLYWYKDVEMITLRSVAVSRFITFDSVYLNTTIFIRLYIFCLFVRSKLKVIVTTHLRKSGNRKNNI